jgi:predicted transcriptional regulator
MGDQVTMEDLHIHGGVVQQVTCMGNVYMHGGVVNTMEVQGDCKQSGGVINRCIRQSVLQTIYHQPEPKVIYRDRVVYKDRKIFCDSLSLLAEKDKLSAENTNLKWENEKLRQALKERDEQQPSDDILISKIRRLENQLAKEREEHRKKVDELEWRLESVTDIANGRNKRIYEDETNGHPVAATDDSLDVLFTLINEYPIGNDVDMAEELGMSISTVRYIAKVLRLSKSPEARREARERLKRHGIEMIERRGGDQTKYKREKQKKTNKKQK